MNKNQPLIWTTLGIDSERAIVTKTEDGYSAGFYKLEGVSVDGYLATVTAPGWTYTARCGSPENAKAWARKTIISDRRAPLQRTAEA